MKPTVFKVACVFGILLLACAVALMLINPQPANNLPQGFFTPIIAFEFMQSPVDVQHFFEVKNPIAYANSMLLGNWVDYGFMLLYSGLLFCIAIGIKKIEKAKVLYFAILLCFTMLAGDALENYQIYHIVTMYTHESAPLDVYLKDLNLYTWIKWGSIASVFLLFSPFFFSGNWFQKIIGFLSLTCFGLCIAAFLHHGILNEIFALNVVLVFTLLVIFVFTFKVPATTERY